MKDVIRATLISPEALVIVIGAAAYFFLERYGVQVGWRVPDEMVKHLALVPSALCVWTFVSGRKVLFPEPKGRPTLQEWPKYSTLKIIFWVGLFYSALFAVIGLVAWAMDWSAGDIRPYILLGTSMSGAVAVVISIYVAQNQIEEIIAIAKPIKSTGH